MLSVIIPIFGKDPSRFTNLTAVLDCIRKQTFRDFELIIVEQYIDSPLWSELSEDSQVSQYFSFKGDPFSNSWCRNIGSNMSSGDVLVHLGADTVFDTDYFDTIYNQFAPGLEYSVGYNKLIHLSKLGKDYYLKDKKYTTAWKKPFYTVSRGPGFHRSCGRSQLFDRTFFFDRLGGFNENYHTHGPDDKDTIFRAYSLVGRKFNKTLYTLLHLHHEKFVELDLALVAEYKYTQRHPLEISQRLISEHLGDPTRRTVINFRE